MSEIAEKEWRYTPEKQNTIEGTRIIGKDIDLQRRIFCEATHQVGVPIMYYKCAFTNEDMYNDPRCTWEDGVQLDVIFEDSPKVKLLKELGWFNEDEEIRPVLIYFPMYQDWRTKEIFDIRNNSLVKVNYYGQTAPAEFRITDKKMDSVYGTYTICKMAPERLEYFEKTQENGRVFLKRADRTEDDRCDHEKVTDSEEMNYDYVADKRVYKEQDYSDYSSLIDPDLNADRF